MERSLDQTLLTPDLTVDRLLACWPLVMPVFFRRRMACVGCAMAPFCSLIEVSRNYGLSLDGLMDELQHGLKTTSVQHTLWE